MNITWKQIIQLHLFLIHIYDTTQLYLCFIYKDNGNGLSSCISVSYSINIREIVNPPVSMILIHKHEIETQLYLCFLFINIMEMGYPLTYIFLIHLYDRNGLPRCICFLFINTMGIKTIFFLSQPYRPKPISKVW